jgi:hypothetical protein
MTAAAPQRDDSVTECKAAELVTLKEQLAARDRELSAVTTAVTELTTRAETAEGVARQARGGGTGPYRARGSRAAAARAAGTGSAGLHRSRHRGDSARHGRRGLGAVVFTEEAPRTVAARPAALLSTASVADGVRVRTGYRLPT